MEKQAKKFLKGAKSNWSKAKRTYVCRTLKELIKAYRACTTKSEERALVKKEAAHIRDLFREGDKAFRRRNIAKLLFFHMNGYPTDFGMTECIKLCASNKYNDKRVAYLGLMILVDETEEILMLMTNCLKQDLHSDEVQIVSLALNVLGDIASVEMVRDLLPEIEKHLLSHNPYIRKKAALASVRAVRKLTPEETTNILHDVPVVFDIKSPAVHISATALVSALCAQQHSNILELQLSVAPTLLNILRDHLLKTGRGTGTEPVIGGVRNPFLQVKVIAALRLLVQSGAPPDLIEHTSDVLAQVAANTETKKVAGCAVLYECIKTITSMQAETSLRLLAVKTCGKFLSHKDPTVRYIALQELTRIVDLDGTVVLGHIDGYKEKVLGAMREADPTVRKRAVELGYRMADQTNVDEMVKELLGYIEKSSSQEAKEDACWKIFMLLDRFGPSDEWKVEMFVKSLSSADTCMPEEIITSFIALISAKPDVQGHAVLRLFTEALVPRAEEAAQGGSDPFNASRQAANGSQSDVGSSSSVGKRKPRLERVALYVLGEHGEVTPGIGLDIPQVLNAFEDKLRISEATDEAWMNTYPPEYHTENRILGEVALTGLVKFACRAVVGSTNQHSTDDPILSLTGSEDARESNPLQAVLAITAPPKPNTEGQDMGLGTDLLASMGLGEDKPKAVLNGTSHALVLGSDLLSNSGQVNTDALMSLEAESSGSGNPIIERVRQILFQRARSSDLETQQRACEYLMLLNESLVSVLASTMAPMPPLDFQKVKERARQRKELRSSRSFSQASKGYGLLLDLLGDGGGSGPEPLALPAGGGDELLALPPSDPTGAGGMTLEDIMGGSSSSAPPGRVSVSGQNLGFALDSLGEIPTTQTSVQLKNLGEGNQAASGAFLSATIFESDCLQVLAQFFREESVGDANTRAELIFSNKSVFLMRNFVFLLAVPKYIKLDMHPASASEISAGGQASQIVNLINSLHGQKPIQLRYRVEYVNDNTGELVQEQGVATGLEAL